MSKGCVVGLVVFVAACSHGDDDFVLDVTYDPCATIAIAPIDATAEELVGIDAALALWSAHGPLALANRELEPAGGSVLTIAFEEAAPQIHGVYDDETGTIYINHDLAEEPRSIVIAHELGHALGLVHVPDDERVSVMNKGNLEMPPTADDAAAVEALWGSCAPIAAPRDFAATAPTARR